MISKCPNNSASPDFLSRKSKRTSFFRNLFIVFLIWLIGGFPSIVFALPQDGQIVEGAGSITTPTATSMQVDQNTNQMIVNWQSFSTAASESVNFSQPSTSSIVLNRVVGTDPSLLLGKLTANGQVFISNGSGVFFGPGSQVDTHGLIATTMGISNQDFLDHNYNFTQDIDNPLTSVINEGNISATSYVGLLAPAVENKGTIVTASLGSVDLAAGKAATLDFTGDGLIQFEVTEAVAGTVTDKDGNVLEDRVSNTGLIQADGGQVRMSAKDAGDVIRHVVNMEGTIEANTVVEKDGRVFLMGGNSGVVNVSGTITAKGDDAGEKGGTVHVLGEKVGLFDNAKVDVSGDVGGGTALIGGDYQGKNKEVQNAFRTYVGENAVINASGGTTGDGGKVIVWADDVTRFYGSVKATGGLESGDGGFIEISGKENLNFTGSVDASSIYGVAGTVLFDPRDIIIANGGSDTVASNDAFAENSSIDVTFDADQITTITNAGTNVILQANQDITVNEAITSNNGGGAGGDITLQAGRSVLINANITTDDGALTITANESTANGVQDADRGAGAAVITMAGGTTINASSGNISITMGDGTGKTNLTSGDITLQTVTTTGTLTIANNGATSGSDILGTGGALTVGSTSSFTTTGDGVITLTNASNDFTGGITLTSATGNIQLTDSTSTAVTSVTTTSGDFTQFTTSGDINIVDNAINSTSGNISLTANTGNIQDSDLGTATSITTTGSIFLGVGTNIGGTDRLEISTAHLTISSGQDVDIDSSTALTDLILSLGSGGSHSHSITAPNLTASFAQATNMTINSLSSTGMNLTLTLANGNLVLADNAISTGSGNVTLNSVLGSIEEATSNTTANITTTGTVSLTAGTSIGTSGANNEVDIASTTDLTFNVNDDLFVNGSSGQTISALDVTVDPSGAATYTLAGFNAAQTFTMSTDGTDLTITDVSNTGAVNQTITTKNGDMLVAKIDSISNVSLTASAGNISQTAALAISGTSSFTVSGINTITLNNASNDFTGAVSLLSGTGAVQLTDSTATILGTSVLGGALTVTSSGDITQNGAIAVAGTTTLDSGSVNSITLDNASNDFSTVAITIGTNVSLTDINDIILGASNTIGTITVKAAGDLTISGDLSTGGQGTLIADSNFSGVGNLTVASAVTVDTSNNALAMQAASIEFSTANLITSGSAATTIDATKGATADGTSLSKITASALTVNVAGDFIIDGVTSLSGISGLLTLTSTGDLSFENNASFHGGAVTVTANNDINVKVDVTSGGDFTAKADNDSSGAGNFTVDSGATVTSIGGNIDVKAFEIVENGTLTASISGSITRTESKPVTTTTVEEEEDIDQGTNSSFLTDFTEPASSGC